MKILLFGYYGDKNLGDEALLQGILNSFRLKNSNLDVTVLSKNPEETQKRYNIRSVIAPRQDRYIASFINEIRKTDLFILGGGGLIQDFIGVKQLIYWVSSLFIAKMFGKKTMLYAIGAGPLKSNKSKKIANFFLKFADIITVRDKETFELLSSIGVNEEKIVLTGDPAFTLSNSEEYLKNDTKGRDSLKNGRTYIGVSFLPYYFITEKPKLEEELENIFSDFIDYVIENYDYNVCLVPLHYMEGETFDMASSFRIFKKLKHKKHAIVMDEPLTPNEAVYLFKEFKAMVGMRLHSLILSGVASTPFLGISYHPKVKSFISLVDQQEVEIEVENITLKGLISKFDKLMENYESQKQKLDKNMEILNEKSLTTQDYVSKLINIKND